MPAPESAARRASFRLRLSRRQTGVASAILIALVIAIGLFVHHRAGRDRRQYEAAMREALDRLLTAQEGFFYDSAHYVGSLRALPTVRPAPGVEIQLVNPDRRSWWGIATHEALKGDRCVVWVGTAPASFPSDVRAPENEAKPMCYDDARKSTSSSRHS